MISNITPNKLFEFLRPEIAESMQRQWEEDGKPEVEAVELVYDIDPDTNEETPFVCLVYTEEEGGMDNEDESTMDDDSIPPSDEWYDVLVERLESGDI